jgi:uncharacterized protein with NRDE domain
MCTIVLFNHVHPKLPVVVAANRDELYARRTAAPSLLASGPRVAGGRDLERGGTWMGVSETGFFVGISNQRTFRAPDPSRRSRGELVSSALDRGETSSVRELLLSVDARAYNPFNLVFGDARELHVAYARESDARIAIEPVPEGIHVLPNDHLDSPAFPKVTRALALARPLAERPWPELARELPSLLADHEMPPLDAVESPPEGADLPGWFTREVLQRLQAVCVHTPLYGTRSSTILALVPGRVDHYLFADGAPCTTPFADRTSLVGGAPP